MEGWNCGMKNQKTIPKHFDLQFRIYDLGLMILVFHSSFLIYHFLERSGSPEHELIREQSSPQLPFHLFKNFYCS